MILVDTNVIARLCVKNDPLNSVAEGALRSLRLRGPRPCIVPQALYEFWVIATRPTDVNGMAMPADRVLRWVAYFKRTCVLLAEPGGTLGEWEELMRTYKPIGKKAHDGRLVAAMHLLGIDSILTFNAGDFSRYGVTVVDPHSVPAP